jgi:hypothetical protein
LDVRLENASFGLNQLNCNDGLTQTIQIGQITPVLKGNKVGMIFLIFFDFDLTHPHPDG